MKKRALLGGLFAAVMFSGVCLAAGSYFNRSSVHSAENTASINDDDVWMTKTMCADSSLGCRAHCLNCGFRFLEDEDGVAVAIEGHCPVCGTPIEPWWILYYGN